MRWEELRVHDWLLLGESLCECIESPETWACSLICKTKLPKQRGVFLSHQLIHPSWGNSGSASTSRAVAHLRQLKRGVLFMELLD